MFFVAIKIQLKEHLIWQWKCSQGNFLHLPKQVFVWAYLQCIIDFSVVNKRL